MHIRQHQNITHQDPIHKISATRMTYHSVLVVIKKGFQGKGLMLKSSFGPLGARVPSV